MWEKVVSSGKRTGKARGEGRDSFLALLVCHLWNTMPHPLWASQSDLARTG
jgi:hypothetical protein